MIIKSAFVAVSITLLAGCGDQTLRTTASPSTPNAIPQTVVTQPDPPPTKILTGIRGQVNLGNTCYFNALMQVLVHSDPVINFVSKAPVEGPVMNSFKRVVQDHWDQAKRGEAYNPSEFLELCRETAGFCFAKNVQEDAHEAYQAIMGIVDEKFSGIFNFNYETVSRCSKPDREYRSKDTASFLGVTIPDSKNAVQVEDFIAEWGAKTTVPGKCGMSKLDDDDEATRESLLITAPEVLVVVLSRVIDPETKRMTPVTYKPELDLGKLLAGRIDPQLISNAPLKYELTGVVHHHGQKPKSGHYVADYLHPRFGKWFHADDSTVRETNVPGTTGSDTPYILLYRKLH